MLLHVSSTVLLRKRCGAVGNIRRLKRLGASAPLPEAVHPATQLFKDAIDGFLECMVIPARSINVAAEVPTDNPLPLACILHALLQDHSGDTLSALSMRCVVKLKLTKVLIVTAVHLQPTQREP